MFHFSSAHPLWRASSEIGPIGILFKEANKIFNPSDAKLKGFNNKKNRVAESILSFLNALNAENF